MKFRNKAALLFAVLLTTGTASAHDISGSIGIGSNYVWRGVTQTNDGPAVSGGIDVSFDSGFYAGVWGANVEFQEQDDKGVEIDVYGGYQTTVGEVSLDAGVTAYSYPTYIDADYVEVYGNAEYRGFSFGLAAMVDGEITNKDRYANVGYYHNLDNGISLGAEVGVHSPENEDDLNHYRLAMKYSEVSVYLDQNDGPDDDMRSTIQWNRTF